jgi:hypothetical protein
MIIAYSIGLASLKSSDYEGTVEVSLSTDIIGNIVQVYVFAER